MAESIKGMNALISKIETLEQLAGAMRGLKAGAIHIKGIISKYSPSTIANSPGNPTGRWYERGYGSKWLRADGSVGGRQSSETLGKRWTQAEREGGLQQVIGNNASYAPYVHSAERQADFHAKRDWKTDEQVLEEEGNKVLEFIQKETNRDLTS